MHTLVSMYTTTVLLFMSTILPAQHKMEWPEKKEFHKVMSQTFHPMEEGNYAPIRERSREMVEKAIA